MGKRWNRIYDPICLDFWHSQRKSESRTVILQVAQCVRELVLGNTQIILLYVPYVEKSTNAVFKNQKIGIPGKGKDRKTEWIIQLGYIWTARGLKTKWRINGFSAAVVAAFGVCSTTPLKMRRRLILLNTLCASTRIRTSSLNYIHFGRHPTVLTMASVPIYTPLPS